MRGTRRRSRCLAGLRAVPPIRSGPCRTTRSCLCVLRDLDVEQWRVLLGAEDVRVARAAAWAQARSEEHTSELQSLMRISYAVFCLKKKNATDSETISIQLVTTTAPTNRTTIQHGRQKL